MSEIRPTATLLAEVFPDTYISHPEYLEWLYLQSPFGAVIQANVDDAYGRIGHYALVPIVMTRDGVDIHGSLSLNTAVHPRARGGGMFTRLASDALAEARHRDLDLVVGVANANSTPGFLRHLGFDLLTSLPVSIVLPVPGVQKGIRSGWVERNVFEPGGLADEIESLLTPPSLGQARRWTRDTLRWRLARPGMRYALHRLDDVLVISCQDCRYSLRVAIILKVFATKPLTRATQRAYVRAVCRFHRAPVALYVGLSDLVDFRGIALPRHLRESPLNLIYQSLRDRARPAPIVRFEFLDFDAY